MCAPHTPPPPGDRRRGEDHGQNQGPKIPPHPLGRGRQLGCPARHVRSLVSELRLEGIAICGHPRTGYFIAATAEELLETCAFLRARAMHSLVLESRLRRIPLGELLGQMRVPT